ncbi:MULTISPECIES: DUF7503 family protein [Halolamina]|nr:MULTISPECIES: hypothetical protein [Halolamina]
MSEKMANYVASHPKLAGVLFMICVLLTQMGSVAAAGNSYVGP